MSLVFETGLGRIVLRLRSDAAPRTVEYITQCVNAGLYNGRNFYRSDFVIQCGLYGSGITHSFGDLSSNETNSGVRISNTRGTCAIAHFDVPDNGNTEFFINLQANTHLDQAYGGYCVFAEVVGDDSFAVVDKIAKMVKAGSNVTILRITVD